MAINYFYYFPLKVASMTQFSSRWRNNTRHYRSGRRTGVRVWLQAPEDAARGRVPIGQLHPCVMREPAKAVRWRAVTCPTSCVCRGAWWRHFRGAKRERSEVTAGAARPEMANLFCFGHLLHNFSLLQLISEKNKSWIEEEEKEKLLKFDAGSEEILLI